jgi:hypothetical protein
LRGIYRGSYRRWLRVFQEAVFEQALQAIEDSSREDSKKRSFGEQQENSRRMMRSVRDKPAWALTEHEAEQLEDIENVELINFASSLDFDAEMKEVEQMVVEVGNNDDEEEPSSEHAVEFPTTCEPKHHHPLQNQLSARVFNFDSKSLADHEEQIDLIDAPRTDRLIVISSDAIRTRIETFSNMPYLRLCPFV